MLPSAEFDFEKQVPSFARNEIGVLLGVISDTVADIVVPVVVGVLAQVLHELHLGFAKGREIDSLLYVARIGVDTHHTVEVEHVRPDTPIHELKLVDQSLRLAIRPLHSELIDLLKGVGVDASDLVAAIGDVQYAFGGVQSDAPALLDSRPHLDLLLLLQGLGVE